MNFNVVLRRCQKLMGKSHELSDFAAALLDAAKTITLSEHQAVLIYQPEALQHWNLAGATGCLGNAGFLFTNNTGSERLPTVGLLGAGSSAKLLLTPLENEQGQVLGCLVSALDTALLEPQTLQLQLVAKMAGSAFLHNRHLSELHKTIGEQQFLLALSDVLNANSREQIQLALDSIRLWFKADAALVNNFSEGFFRSEFSSGISIERGKIHPIAFDHLIELWEKIKENPRLEKNNAVYTKILEQQRVAFMVVQSLSSQEPTSDLELLWNQPTEFSDDQLRVLKLVSRMLGAAIRHQFTTEKLRYRQQQIEVLGKLAQVLHDAKNTEVLAARVLNLMSDTMRSTHGTFLLFQDECLSIAATRSLIRSARLLTQSNSMAFQAIEKRVIQVVKEDQIELYGMPTTQLYCPMFSAAGQPLGVLICAREANWLYAPEDLQILDQIGQNVATAIERLRSVEQLEKQLLNHQQLLTLSRLLDSSDLGTAKQTIQSALERLSALVRADYVHVNRRTGQFLDLAYETPDSLFPKGFPDKFEIPLWVMEKSSVINAVMRGETVHLADTSKQKILRKSMAEVGYKSFWSTSFEHTAQGSWQLSIFRFKAGGWNTDEQHLLETAARMLGAMITRHQNQELLFNSYQSAIRATGLMLESRDFETAGHTDRVVTLATRFAQELKLSEQETQDLRWGAYLHDIGKIIVPDSILNKPSKLNAQERRVVESHAVQGEKIALSLPFLSDATRSVIRSHHERMDGTGYPDQLKGNDIPLLARMFAICDVYDALRHERPYKKAMSRNVTTVTLIQSGENGHLDSYLVQIFIQMLETIQIGQTLFS